jgi:hypothetical protein
MLMVCILFSLYVAWAGLEHAVTLVLELKGCAVILGLLYTCVLMIRLMKWNLTSVIFLP